jgi:hypothetical protein
MTKSTARLTALVSGLGSLSGAHAHPGHVHSSEPLARLVHSITEWGPLLVVLVVMVAAGYRLWRSDRD